MKLVTKSELARLCGVTRAGIGQAAKRGKLDVVGEGPTAKIDITSDKAVAYINACDEKKKSGVDNSKKTSPAKQKSDKQSDNLPETQTINFDSDEIDLTMLSAASANKLKTLEDIKTKRQARLAARKELVQRKSVRRILAKLYTIDVNEHLTVGDKLAPDIAAICKVDDPAVILAINEAIEKEMYKILGHRKRLMNEFLKDVEADELEE